MQKINVTYFFKSLFATVIVLLLASCTPQGFETVDFPVNEPPPVSLGNAIEVAIQAPMAGTEVSGQIALSGNCATGDKVLISGDLSAPAEAPCIDKKFQATVILSDGDGSKTVTAYQASTKKTDSKIYIKDGTIPQITLSSPAAGTYLRSQLSVTGTCENGLEVYVRVVDQVSSTSCVNGMYTAQMTMTAPDGAIQFQISQRDRVGNIGYAAQNLVKDTVAPIITITSPAANASAVSSVTVTGACENGLPVAIAGAGVTSVSTTCASASYSQSVSLTAGDGSKIIEVSQVDTAGNRGQISRTVIRDSSAPNLTIMSPAANTIAASGVTITGTCEVGRSITVSGAGVSATSTATCASGSFSQAIVFSTGEGNKVVNLSQTDTSGNQTQVSRTFIKDSIRPVIQISSPAANATVTSPVQITGLCEAGSDVNLSGAGLASATSVACASNGSFSVQASLSTGDGAKSISFNQTDPAGNAATTVTRSLNRQEVSPAPEIRFSSPAANSLGRTGVTIAGTCQAGLPVNISGTGVAAASTATCASGTFSAAITFSANDGNKSVMVAQTNSSGTTGSDTRIFLKDATPPVLGISNPMANQVVLTATVSLMGTCEAGLTVSISGAGVASASTTACNAGSFSSTITLSSGDGNKVIQVAQTDAAGNAGSTSRTITRDTTVPVLAFSSPAANSRASSGLSIAGSCETGLSVTVAGAGVMSSGAVACTSGVFSYAVTFSSGEGNKVVEISQTDAAGNRGSASRTFVRDSVAPVLAYTSPAANRAAATGLTIAGSCETGLSVAIAGAGVAASSTTSCTSGAFSQAVNFSNGEGNKVIEVSQTDAAGNRGAVSRTFVRDSVAPVLAFLSPAANSSGETGLTITGSCETGLSITVAGAGVSSSTTANCNSATFSHAISFSSGDGSKLVEISQTDAAGNRGSSSRTFVQATPVLDGGLLYANNCSACHGPLGSSAKLGKSAAQITSAIGTVPTMSSLNMLSAAQIQAIAVVLNNGGDSAAAARFLAAKQVIQSNCMGCHFQGGSAPSFNLETDHQFVEQGFVVAGSLERSKIIYRLRNYPGDITGKTMPPAGPLTQTQYDTLAQWVLNMPGSSTLQNYFTCNQNEEPDTLNAKRLSKTQLYNTLHGLLARPFGASAATTQLTSSSSFFYDRVPNDSKAPYSRSDSNFEYLHAKAYFDIADELSTWMVDSTRYANFVNTYIRYNQGSCSYTNPNTLDVTCRTVFLRNFVLRAFGRPIEENATNNNNEMAAYLAEFALSGSNTTTWVNNVVFRILTSPSFLMDVSSDVTLQSGDIYRLSDYAIARRLSLNYMQTGLDEGLLTIIQNSTTTSAQKFDSALTYVMARSESTVRDFTDEWLKLYRVPAITNQSHAKLQRIASGANLSDAALVPAMRTEVQDLMAYLNRNNRPATEILTSNVSFAQNANLRLIYGQGTSAPSWSTTTEANAVRFPAAERSGVISRAAFLLSGGITDRLVIRGAHIRDQILCLELSGSVPPNASMTPLPTTDNMTTRQKYEAVTASSTCIGCHSQLNPVGFAMSGYNALGGYQTQEPIFNSSGTFVRELPVDSQVNLLTITGSTSNISGGVDLATELSQTRDFKRCLTQTFYSYFNRMPQRSRAQNSCAMQSMYQVIDGGGTVNNFLRATAQHPNFQLRKVVKD